MEYKNVEPFHTQWDSLVSYPFQTNITQNHPSQWREVCVSAVRICMVPKKTTCCTHNIICTYLCSGLTLFKYLSTPRKTNILFSLPIVFLKGNG